MTAASCQKHDDQDFNSIEMCCNCGGGRFGNSSIQFKEIISFP